MMEIELDLWIEAPPSQVLADAIGRGYITENMGRGMLAIRTDGQQLVAADRMEEEIASFLQNIKIDKRWLEKHPGTLRVACYVDYNKQASATIPLSQYLISILCESAISIQISVYPCSDDE